MSRVLNIASATVSPEQIQQGCQGDREELARVVEYLLPVLRVEVAVTLQRRGRLHSRDARQDVDDFVQDILVHLLSEQGRVLRRWAPARGRSLSSFVRLVARHRISRSLGGFRGNPWSSQPTEAGQLDASDSSPSRRIESRVQLTTVLDRIHSQLNERGVRLFHLLYVEQRSVAEVCELEGMSRAALDQWNARLRKLARRITNEGETS
ncbi:MAG: hypothetical protein KUG77_14705 [Nannocystaceae bacterium]|nr:hypothetical protein [Nannocystaceae bacterium]